MERLLIVQACQELVVRAAACADAHDAAALAALFTPAAVLVRPGAQPLEGRDAIRLSYESRPADRITRHFISNLLVDIDSPQRARVRSYALLWTASKAEAEGPQGRPAHARQLVGEFDDVLVRDAEGTWLIERREARFVMHRDS